MNADSPQIIRDLLDIHLLLSEVESFSKIVDYIHSLEAGHPDKNYDELKRITRLLRNVLEAFANKTGDRS